MSFIADFNYDIDKENLNIDINKNILDENIDDYKSPLSNEQIKMIEADYQYYISHRVEDTLVDIIEMLYEDIRTRGIVLANMVYNMEESSLHEFHEILYLDIEIKETIEKNLDYLLEKLDERKIFFLIKSELKFKDEEKAKLNNFLEKNKLKYFKYLLRIKIIEMRLNEQDENIFIEVISKIIDEILANEQKTIMDIIELESGAYSEVFQIGDKILKIGHTRETYKIPYNKRILQPIIRVNLNDFSDIWATIEVSDRVDTNVNLTDKELYELYKELREQGIIFTDLKQENLGILLKKNEKHWKTSIADNRNAEGFIRNNELEEPLEAGDIVIIDTDFLYKEGDSNITWPLSRSRQFERMYQKEKRSAIEKQAQGIR